MRCVGVDHADFTADGKTRASKAIPNSGNQDGSVIVNSWLDRGLWERCITRGVPSVMLPGAYNNNYQIVQAPDYVVILAEMIHDARIIPIDGRPHLGSTIRQWMGDSICHWEGETLVVDTTNFTDQTRFRGSTENLRVVERFSRVSSNALLYRFTIEDPATWTQPWTGEYTWPVTNERLFEYACHEANYALGNILRGARLREADEEKLKK